jgi:capsular exopolysaccharide synthesis family protein
MSVNNQAPRIDYLRLMRRVVTHRWRILLIGFLLVAAPIAAWVVLGSDHTYEASATLFLLPDKADPAFLKEFLTPEANSLYLVVLKSRSLAQAVAEALPRESRDELTKRIVFRDYFLTFMNSIRRMRGEEVIVYSPTETLVRELQEARMAFNIGKDGTVALTATAFSPRVAVDIANTYVEVLLSRSSAFARQQTRGTRELLENLLAQAKTGQQEAEDSLRKFQVQGGVKLPEDAKLDITRLAQLETTLADLQVNREIAQKRLAYLKGELKAGAALGTPEPLPDPAVQVLRERLGQSESKLATLTQRFTDQHPLVLSARAEVADGQERLKNALLAPRAGRPAGAIALKPIESAQLAKQMSDLEVEVIATQAREQSLQQRIGQLKRSLTSMNSREQEYSTLSRTTETQRNLVAMLAGKLTAARISEQSHIRGIQVVDLATLPKQPSSKQALKLLLMGLLGGLACGFGLGTVREYISQVIETEEEVAGSTGFRVLGSLPTTPVKKSDELKPVDFMTLEGPLALASDACRSIRTGLDVQALDDPFRTLLVTSAGISDGKTSVVLGLARAFLETNRRVLLIDLDLRRPSLHRGCGVQNTRGVAEVLHGSQQLTEAAVEIAPGLTLLPAGAARTNPGALLSSRRTIELIESARERADIVIIDSPPVLAVSDTLPLLAHVDRVLFVARAGVTQRRAIARAKDLLQKAGARVAGVVVNGLSSRDSRRYYAGYYSYVDAQDKQSRKTKRKVQK